MSGSLVALFWALFQGSFWFGLPLLGVVKRTQPTVAYGNGRSSQAKSRNGSPVYSMTDPNTSLFNSQPSSPTSTHTIVSRMECGDLYSWGTSEPAPSPNMGFRGSQLYNIAGGYGTTCTIGANVGFVKLSPKHEVMLDQLPSEIKDMAFGLDHALALTGEGKMYAWGSAKWGQVGLGATPHNPQRPTLIKGVMSDKVVTSISCGSLHSACLTSTGDVYTWGRGFEGQTGHASKALDNQTNDIITSVQLLPKCVSSFVKTKVVSVACGEKFTVCVTEKGEVWSWGEGGR